ncbi:MAG: DNA polymerase III subunit alpha [Streptosporangiales bacterium]|nr:DNA polymerase III subunit alpha [Streptosporangiales bacterium]
MKASRALPPCDAHLHVASSYSLRYGVAHPRILAERASSMGIEVLALTDRDGLYGAVKHVQACHQLNVGSAVGCDLALTGEAGRVVLLASGRRGWASLCRLVSAAHLSGERGTPEITRELVARHADGLVALLGPASDVGRALAARRPDLAAARLRAWQSVTDAVVEVVDHFTVGGHHQALRAMRLATETGAQAVLSNEVRYLEPEDAAVAQVLDATRRLSPLEGRYLQHLGEQGYLKSAERMTAVAERVCGPDRDAARRLIETTRAVARRCVLDPAADLGMGDVHLPEAADDAPIRLYQRCEAGLARRGLAGDGAAIRRLGEELAIIERKGYCSYFLTVADVADLIRSHGIRCAIRGSGAGSLVNYLLGISDIDPLANDLLMERFMSDHRKGLPDIDLDVESARRLDAYRAIRERYGDERFACVSMMETYRARSAIRDVGGAIGLPPHEIDTIAKAFPHIRARQIRASLDDLPELRGSGLAQGALAALFRLAERLDGLPRHIALHPCGLLLSNATLRDRTPVERSMLEFPMSQFDKDDVEEMGLIKLDVLGVRMQSAMAHTLDEIDRTGGGRIDLEKIPFDDAETYRMIEESRTLGCFQIESPGQRDLVSRLKPACFDDIVVDISLFRPGPVNSDMVTPFIDTRNGRRKGTYASPRLEPILRDTGGVVVFHEQVIKIIHKMTACGPDFAEGVRRRLENDVSKEEIRDWFFQVAGLNADRETVERVWGVLAAFGAFGFCKAHATAFAVPTYQSSWLKRHHTAAFYAGVLTHDPGMYPKRAIVDDARHFGVPILPLDVNASARVWHVERTADGAEGIRVALSEVKGISDAEVGRIEAGRPYGSLADLWHRAGVSRPVVENIVLVGGFDGLHDVGGAGPSRRDLLARVGALDRAGRRAARPGADGSSQLPLGFVEQVMDGELPEMSPADRIEVELDILGIDVTGHVLDFYSELLEELGVVRARDLGELEHGEEVLVAGVKVATQTPAVRSGQRVIFATLDDSTGLADLTFFESVQAASAATVFGSWLMVARGHARRTGGRLVTLRATGAWDLPELEEIRRRDGVEALHAAVRPAPPDETGVGGTRLEYANGYRLSPYSDINPAGGAVRHAPRRLWHASGGSSGGWLPAAPSRRRRR